MGDFLKKKSFSVIIPVLSSVVYYVPIRSVSFWGMLLHASPTAVAETVLCLPAAGLLGAQ